MEKDISMCKQRVSWEGAEDAEVARNNYYPHVTVFASATGDDGNGLLGR